MGRSGLERLVEWLRRDPGTLASIGTALALPAIPLAVWGGQYRWLALVLPFVALLPVAVGRLLRISRKALDDAVTAVLGGTGIVAILLAIFWSGERWLAVVPGALTIALVIYSDTLTRGVVTSPSAEKMTRAQAEAVVSEVQQAIGEPSAARGAAVTPSRARRQKQPDNQAILDAVKRLERRSTRTELFLHALFFGLGILVTFVTHG
jgi:hypothetical protein